MTFICPRDVMWMHADVTVMLAAGRGDAGGEPGACGALSGPAAAAAVLCSGGGPCARGRPVQPGGVCQPPPGDPPRPAGDPHILGQFYLPARSREPVWPRPCLSGPAPFDGAVPRCDGMEAWSHTNVSSGGQNARMAVLSPAL